jgi:hypothetical protein
MGEVNPAFFDYFTIHQYPTATTTAFFTDPAIFLPLTRVDGAQLGTDTVLQSKQVGFDCGFVYPLAFNLHEQSLH